MAARSFRTASRACLPWPTASAFTPEDPSAFDMSHRGPGSALAVESEADERAVTLLIDGQYDPRSLIEMITRLAHAQPSGWADYRCEQLFACLNEQPQVSRTP